VAGKKILIVEDDRNLVEVLRYNLVKEGYEVATAFDGSQALGTASRSAVSCVTRWRCPS
jgi:DNA-binding response OmpR family regulator